MLVEGRNDDDEEEDQQGNTQTEEIGPKIAHGCVQEPARMVRGIRQHLTFSQKLQKVCTGHRVRAGHSLYLIFYNNCCLSFVFIVLSSNTLLPGAL